MPREKREDVEVWKVSRPGKKMEDGQFGPDEVVGHILGKKGQTETLGGTPVYATPEDAEAAIPTVPVP
jgi:hypothetical protein